jgi:hypothetical protein
MLCVDQRQRVKEIYQYLVHLCLGLTTGKYFAVNHTENRINKSLRNQNTGTINTTTQICTPDGHSVTPA